MWALSASSMVALVHVMAVAVVGAPVVHRQNHLHVQHRKAFARGPHGLMTPLCAAWAQPIGQGILVTQLQCKRTIIHCNFIVLV